MLNESNLHNYQNRSADHVIDNPFAGLLLDMGLGKTVSTLTAIKRLIDWLEVSKVLVIAPKRVVLSVWAQECEKWEHLRGLKVVKVVGTPKQRKAALKERADVYLIGRDSIAWLVGQYGGSMLPFDMLVIDESSSFKNHASKRFKALKGAQPSFDRVVLLTGTPAPNGLADLWSQIYLLDRGERLGKTIGRYRERFLREGHRNGHIVYNYLPQNNASEREVYRRIGDICISMKAEDFLDMPEQIVNNILIELPPDAMKKYKDFEREKVLELVEGLGEGEEISAINSAALSVKLLQFANGAVYDADRNVHEMHPHKLDELGEILEQGQNVLLAWTYKHDRDRILARFEKYKPVQMSSDADVVKWNKGEIKLLMMHPASGGHGLNLQGGGSVILHFGQTWSAELRAQFNARLYRQGQKSRTVILNNLITKGTLDERVISTFGRKTGKQNELFEATKAVINEVLKDRK